MHLNLCAFPHSPETEQHWTSNTKGQRCTSLTKKCQVSMLDSGLLKKTKFRSLVKSPAMLTLSEGESTCQEAQAWLQQP